VTRPAVYAIAVTHGELGLLLRAMRTYHDRDESPMAADVVAMLENALDEPALAAFALAGEEIAS
jgi:hypothetical protein